jgi:hypothetical protein
MIRTGTFRYVVWSQIDRYVTAGWIPGVAASDYSVIMWACDCNQDGREPTQ